MQKREREITDQNTLDELLRRGKYAIIALCRNNEPYIVALSYGYDANKKALYFHTAHKGLKLEYMKTNPDVCGTVVEDRGYIMGECAHSYRSVVFHGKLSIARDLEEKKHGMDVMLQQLEEDPDVVKRRFLKDDRAYARATILRLDIGDMTGKAGR
jgi:nitroimidazol reductase NimA-like FMN-containing flavoprotein (pyridoxamine 5'-phosphate oxidase superfamily)